MILTCFRFILKALIGLFFLGALFFSSRLYAGFTETLPRNSFMLDVAYVQSWLNNRFDNDGKLCPLIDKIDRYEPGGGLQGIITPEVKVSYMVLITQLQYGLLDNLTLGFGIPLVLSTKVVPTLNWTPGDYQSTLGRPYSADDFWAWAESMGQPKPGNWSGNNGKLSDLIIGIRYRWTDKMAWFQKVGLKGAITIMGAIPTSSQPDPEEIVAAGTTLWDLHSQGELCFHLSFDKTFEKALDGRLVLGLDLFYEKLFPHVYTTPEGKKSPLLLNYKPYVGDTYILDPGDFLGFSFLVDVIPYKGPIKYIGVNKNLKGKTAAFPPILTITLMYTFTYLFQSDWQSNSDLWDWDREKLWLPGYKNILTARVTFSFLRLGVPLQIYAGYRTVSLIPGKNTRTANTLTIGTQIPFKFF